MKNIKNLPFYHFIIFIFFRMSDLSKLSIYDNPVQARPMEQPVANIHDVSGRILHKLVFGPIRCAKYHLTKWGNQAVDHVTRWAHFSMRHY